MFLDHATIEVLGGRGGRGCVSWRREKYAPKGGPDGGDGGRGGDVLLIADEQTDTLSMFGAQKNFEAEKGRFGMGKNKRGKDGEDLILRVPPGTLVLKADDPKHVIGDLSSPGAELCIAHGGRGGYGNAHFVSSVRQRPDFAELGEPGEKQSVTLELKLVADVGIIGFPSVGKSTLIAAVSRARPKIADYPFTTLVPNLGVATVHERSFVLCDIPGLIEGASTGRGLGHDFLRHIERCGILLHVLDLSNGLETNGALNPAPLIEAYRILRKELSAHSPVLAEKQEVVVLNKCDLTTEDLTPLCTTLAKHGIKIDAQISAAAHGNTENLLKMLLPLVLKEREKREVLLQQESHDLPVLRPHETADRMGAFRIERHNGTLVVLGTRIEQFTRMTDFTSEGACKRFRDVLSRTGIAKAIAREREKEEETYIGDIRVDEYL